MISDLANSDVAETNVYELRFLRFSAIFLAALWLKSVKDSSDVIVPLAPRGLQAGTRYSAADFLAAIRPLAQERVNKADPAKVP